MTTEKPETASTRSRSDIVEAIQAFSAGDWLALDKVARLFAYGTGGSPDDLKQEALTRALEGTRSCPSDVPVRTFLAQTIRSIADGERDKQLLRLPAEAVAIMDAAGGPPDVKDDGLGVEERMVRAEEDEKIRNGLFGLFPDDPTACDILDGLMTEMTPNEIRDVTGLDSTAYASKRRLMRRRIDKEYSEGWPS